MADIRSGIVPLNGSNFPTWKIQVRMALLKQGVWKIVEGTEVCPDEYDQPANYRKFCERRDRALSTIVLAVETSLLYLLGDPQDPQEVWTKLCDQFQRKTWANKLSLRRRLYGLRLKDNEPVQDHIKQITEIFEELAVIGEPVEEEDQVVHVLSSLPDSFDMLVTALEASPEVPSLEIVTERLLHEERKRKEKLSEQRKSSESSHDALFVGSQRRYGGPTCFYCGEKGHIKSDCKEWKKKLEEKDKNNEQSENKRQTEIANLSYLEKNKNRDSDSDEYECIALVSKAAAKTNKWIVDSAATDHMCSNRNDMQEIRRLDNPQNVKVGNGEFVQANYKGTVKLEVKSGSNRTRKVKLHEVLLVPKLKYNLFSVSRAAQVGKKVEFNCSGCKIVDDSSDEIIVSASRIGELYYLDCAYKEKCQKPKRNMTARKGMETALLSVRANNFKDEMMKRLNSIEDGRINIERRLDKIEESKARSASYPFKEEIYQNRCAGGNLINFLKENVNNTCTNDELESKFDLSEVEDSSEENEQEDIIVEGSFEKSEEDSAVSSFEESEEEYIEDSEKEDLVIEVENDIQKIVDIQEDSKRNNIMQEDRQRNSMKQEDISSIQEISLKNAAGIQPRMGQLSAPVAQQSIASSVEPTEGLSSNYKPVPVKECSSRRRFKHRLVNLKHQCVKLGRRIKQSSKRK